MENAGPGEGARAKKERKRNSETPNGQSQKESKRCQNQLKQNINTTMLLNLSQNRCWDPLSSNMLSTRFKIETNIHKKTASGRKTEFSLPYSKANGFLMICYARGFHFRDQSLDKSFPKRSLTSIAVFNQIFIDVGSFLVHVGSQKGCKR